MTTDAEEVASEQNGERDPMLEKSTSLNAKERLEVRKLELEIEDLQRSAWFKPAVMIPIVATLVTLGISWSLGVFDVEQKRIQVSTDMLDIRREKLTQEVAQLQQERKALEDTKAGLRQEVNDLKVKLDSTSAEYKAARDELRYTREVLARPILEIDQMFFDLQKDVSISVRNVGKGKADIQSIRAYVDDKYVSEGPSGRRWNPILDGLDIDEVWVRYQWLGGYMDSGEKQFVLMIEPNFITDETVYRFKAAASRLGLEVCYCSTFGKCTWASYHRPKVMGASC